MKKILLLFASLALLASCSDDQETSVEGKITTEIETIMLENEIGASAILEFSATLDWKISELDASTNWLTVAPMSGKPGQCNVTVTTLSTNENVEEFRTATLTITCGKDIKLVTVTQEKKDWKVRQHEVLAEFYKSTNGANWINIPESGKWEIGNPMSDMSKWEGISVDEDGRVISIVLASKNLVGFIPESFGELTYLRYLTFLVNPGLTGSLPTSIGNLKKLESFILADNGISGAIPKEIGNLTQLKKLSISKTQLSGSIPEEIGRLTNLTNLSVVASKLLTGTIPESIGNLVNLAELSLFNNQLSGSIPRSIGNLKKLKLFQCENNQLTGSIPDEIGNLEELTDLYLDKNKLSGAIPATIGNMKKLQRLSIPFNELSGTIPSEIGNLSEELLYIELNNNQLGGSLPPEMGNLKNVYALYLDENSLTGSIPSSFQNMTSMIDIYISYNRLAGQVPPEVVAKMGSKQPKIENVPNNNGWSEWTRRSGRINPQYDESGENPAARLTWDNGK